MNALDNGDDFEDVYEDDDEFKKTIFGLFVVLRNMRPAIEKKNRLVLQFRESEIQFTKRRRD